MIKSSILHEITDLESLHAFAKRNIGVIKKDITQLVNPRATNCSQEDPNGIATTTPRWIPVSRTKTIIKRNNLLTFRT